MSNKRKNYYKNNKPQYKPKAVETNSAEQLKLIVQRHLLLLLLQNLIHTLQVEPCHTVILD